MSGSSRGCSSLWSRTLCPFLFLLLPFVTIPSLFLSHKNSLNIYMTLRRGSMSGFLSSSLFIFVLNFPRLRRSFSHFHCYPISFSHCYFALVSLPRQGGVKINSPLSTRFCSSPNSARAPVSTSSRDMVLQLWRNTCTSLWIQSTMSAPNIRCPARALFY